MPSRLTLAPIEGMLARDEAQPEACRHAAAREADGPGPGHTWAWPGSWRSGSICSAEREPSGSRANKPSRRTRSLAPEYPMSASHH